MSAVEAVGEGEAEDEDDGVVLCPSILSWMLLARRLRVATDGMWMQQLAVESEQQMNEKKGRRGEWWFDVHAQADRVVGEDVWAGTRYSGQGRQRDGCAFGGSVG